MSFKKIDRDSLDTITNAVEIFQVPPTNVTISSSKTFEILPSNPLTDTPFHFKIHSSENFIDLSKCYLFTEFRIRKENANGQPVNITLDENVAPIQMIGSTFINNMRISINGREIFNSNSLYAYKTYFSHELSYSLGAKSSHLNAAGYYYDSGVSQESGASFNSRRNLFVNSRTAQFVSKLDADLFNQPQYLVNHCEVDIEILPNETKFLLIAPLPVGAQPTRYIFEVVSCKLYVKKLDLMDGLALDIARRLDVKPARYAIRKTMMKPLFISQGRYEFHANLFMDQIPRRITLGLVANSDYVGTQERSPFNFQPFRVREISIIANGRSYPQSPYDFDYGSNRYVRAFHDMNDAIGFSDTPENNGITYQQYGRTHCIYVFNLTNSGEDNGGTFDLIKNGSTAVNIKFSQAVPEGGVMLIVMGETDALIMLDKNRSITSDTTI
uniref:Major sperm protein n=1 Tax=Meloidogyne incognita TaxID=6306 RepID=A0A914NG41_MELIC